MGEAGETGTNITDHTGSVTFIQNGITNILIDVGGRGRLPEIQSKLAERKVTLDNIDIIILTHFHLDHAFNVAAFPKARVIGWNHEWNEKSTFRFKDIEGREISDGISLLSTPGHTPEHLSVVAKGSNGKRIVIAGDAINNHYIEKKDVSAYAFDKVLYQKSADSLMEISDEFILGHG